MREGCQWTGPEQDPSRSRLVYCGAKVLAGKSYCAEHYARCYTKPKKEKHNKVAKLPTPKINF